MQLTGNVEGIIDLLGGGSDVEVTPILVSGTKIATINVDGVDYDLYVPTPETPEEVNVTPILVSGTKIATIGVGDNSYDLYAPTPESPEEVSVTPILVSGTKIATIGVGDNSYDLYAPNGGFPPVQNHPPHGTNFNNLKTSALYEIDNFLTSWYTNQPMPEGYSDVGQLYVIRSSNCIIQFAVNVQRAYFRVCFNISGNQWWSWRRIDNN